VNAAEASSKVSGQFALSLATDTSGLFTFRDLQRGVDYNQTTFGTGRWPILWVVNNSGATIQYEAPTGAMQTVGNNQWDLWAMSYLVFDNASATTPTAPMTDLKFAFTGGAGSITMDNLSIQDVPLVPEPAATGWIAAAFVGCVIAGKALVRGVAKWRVSSEQ
jgi:hypothetical protein